MNPAEKRFLMDYKERVEECERRSIQSGKHKEAARKAEQIVQYVLNEIENENLEDGEAYALISVLFDGICMKKRLDKDRVVTCLALERAMLNVEDEDDEEDEGGTEQ